MKNRLNIQNCSRHDLYNCKSRNNDVLLLMSYTLLRCPLKAGLTVQRSSMLTIVSLCTLWLRQKLFIGKKQNFCAGKMLNILRNQLHLYRSGGFSQHSWMNLANYKAVRCMSDNATSIRQCILLSSVFYLKPYTDLKINMEYWQ